MICEYFAGSVNAIQQVECEPYCVSPNRIQVSETDKYVFLITRDLI